MAPISSTGGVNRWFLPLGSRIKLPDGRIVVVTATEVEGHTVTQRQVDRWGEVLPEPQPAGGE